ncbi:MAG: hypothetical protein JW942_03745 [Opitutales bacterium]|nr:hypothetical protein [Opitutales bacterium]
MALIAIGAISMFAQHALALPTLTGLTTFNCDSTGQFISNHYWDSEGDNPVYNVYVFTGSVDSPSFLTTGNAIQNPGYEFTVGTHTLGIAMETTYISNLGINLWFDDDRVNNRISAVIPIGGGAFSVIESGISTFSYWTTSTSAVTTPGSDTLSYTSDGLTVTLTGLSITTLADNVSAFDAVPSGGNDITALMTFTVTAAAVPEPSSYATAAGLLVLGLAAYRRKSDNSKARPVHFAIL